MPSGEQWKNELVEILTLNNGRAHLSDIYSWIVKRGVIDISFQSWKASVRKNLEIRSSDSDAFTGVEDLFYSVDGKGKGNWGLRGYMSASNDSFKGDCFGDELDRKENEFIARGIFTPANLQAAREIIIGSIVQRRGQSSFRERLLVAYNHTCAISQTKCDAAIEAAHIIPYMGEETNHIQNGVLLRSDIHTLFDLHLIRIAPDYVITVDESIKDPCYRKYDGRKLTLPEEVNNHPSKEALIWRSKEY